MVASGTRRLGETSRCSEITGKKYRVGGVKREIDRIRNMGKDARLRDLVSNIRGRRRTFGRSIGPRGRSRSVKGIHSVRKDSKRRKEHLSHLADSSDLFNEAERRSLRRFEAWCKKLPSEELRARNTSRRNYGSNAQMAANAADDRHQQKSKEPAS